jgi:hypothetical protein
VVLLVVGILTTGVGALVVGFGIPINALPQGQAMILAGAMGLVGGPILIGLAFAVSRLTQIADALKTRPANRGARAPARSAEEPVADLRPEVRVPGPRPTESRNQEVRHFDRQVEARRPEPRLAEVRPPDPRTMEAADGGERRAEAETSTVVSAAAIERLRSTMVRPAEVVPLSPNGSQAAAEQGPAPNPVEAATETTVVEVPTRGGGAGEGGKEARLEFLFRPRPARRAPQESFETMWPKRAAQGGGNPPRVLAAVGPSAAETQESAPAPQDDRHAEVQRTAPPPAMSEQQRSVAILKSGVVDGMAYTLYADGSIEAELPQGTVRFGSIAELRSHVDSNS